MRARMTAALIALAAAALAAPLRAADERRPTEAPRPASERRDGGRQGSEPLTPEDKELLRELALLERVELLRNLELFEPAKAREVQPDRRSR